MSDEAWIRPKLTFDLRVPAEKRVFELLDNLPRGGAPWIVKTVLMNKLNDATSVNDISQLLARILLGMDDVPAGEALEITSTQGDKRADDDQQQKSVVKVERAAKREIGGGFGNLMPTRGS